MFPSRRSTLGGDVFRDEYSLAFDGTDGYLDLGSDLFGTTGDFTYSLWFYLTSAPTDNDPLIYSSNDSLIRFRNSSSPWYLQIVPDNAGDATRTASPDSIVIGTWYHLAATRTSGAVQMYFNSVSGDSVTNANTMSLRYIGGDSSSKFTPVKISEVATYDIALTAAQVKTLYNSREPYNHKEGIATGNLIGWFRMGDGLENHAGTTIYDTSANSNNGTMTNMDATTDYRGEIPK